MAVRGEVAEYIRNTIKEGYQLSAIKKQLRTSGYTRQDVHDSAMWVLHKTPPLFASFQRRVLGGLVDLAILTIIALVLSAVLGAVAGFGLQESLLSLTNITAITPWIYLCVLVASFGYYVSMQAGQYESTLGEGLVGVKVVSETGAKLSVKQASIRYVGMLLSTILLLAGHIAILLSDTKRSWHDHLASTIVVRV